MAQVLCCYTVPGGEGARSSRQALAAVRRHAPAASVIDVTGDDLAYWREIRARWQGAEDLIVIEHDIVTGPGTVASLEECGEPWCVFAYDVFGCRRLVNALGCVKFSAALQRSLSLDDVAARFAGCGHCHGEGCWWHLDIHLAAVLQGAGLAPHVHGDVAHLHDYASFGTISLCEGIMSVFSWEAGQEPVQYHVPVPEGTAGCPACRTAQHPPAGAGHGEVPAFACPGPPGGTPAHGFPGRAA